VNTAGEELTSAFLCIGGTLIFGLPAAFPFIILAGFILQNWLEDRRR
jgi:hypothetical protein